MRIISGKYGGRTFQPPAKMPYTRPTTDLAKGGLFNVIENNLDIESLKTLDLFGGTGSISYELASRGATDQTIVEKDSNMAAFIQQTGEKLGVKLKIVKMDVFKYIENCNEKFDFIFAKQLLNDGGWFVLEHTPRNSYTNFPFYRAERNYGTTIFSIFVNKPKEE